MNHLEETLGKFDRIYYLIEYLANLHEGLTVEDIAEETGKSSKTVRRDLESINAIFGLDLVRQRGPDKKYRYRIEKQAVPFRPLVLDLYEVVSLYFIRGFSHFKDVGLLHKNVNRIFGKIKLNATESRKRSGNNFHERVCNLFILPKELGGKNYNNEIGMDFLEKLIEAAVDYKMCNITYRKGEINNKYKIAPLHLFNYRDALYLLAHNIDLSSKGSSNIYTNFALHRLKDVEILDEYFDYPSNFDIKKHFKSGAFNFADEVYNVVLEFPTHMKDYILERDWYPNQQIEVQKDGSVIMTFQSDLNMIDLGWIRGFGSDVKVLGPEELIKLIKKDLKHNLKQY